MICRGDLLGSQGVVLCDGRCLTEPPRTVSCDHSPLHARVSSLVSSDSSECPEKADKSLYRGSRQRTYASHGKVSLDANSLDGPAMKD